MAYDVTELPFGKLYALYLAKVTKKGRSQAELDAVLGWLTGYSPAAFHASELPLRDFYAAASFPPAVQLITGVVCGVRVETLTDPVMQPIRWGDKLVDELARGKAVATIIRD